VALDFSEKLFFPYISNYDTKEIHLHYEAIKIISFQIWIGGIWLITFLCGWISTWQVYVQIVYAIFLLGPALAIIGISITIAILLKRRQKPGQKNAPPFVSVSKIVDNQLSKVKVDSPIPGSPKMSSGYGSAPGTPVKPTQRKMISSATALQRRNKKDKQAVIQLFLIVGSFLLGYIPLTGKIIHF